MAPIAQIQSNSGSPSSSTRNDYNNGPSFVQKYLNDCKSFYSCIYCRTHLANHDELVSRSFQGNRSRAYLFNSVINISSGPAVQRELNTGSHAVADIFCKNCGTTMGWKYEKAYVETQKYKEGKYIIELTHVVRENRHLEFDKRDILLGQGLPKQSSQPTTTLQTDSGIGSSLSSGHHKGGSASPPSYTDHWSSPASSSNDEEVVGTCDEVEEELMFPFYEDLCSNRSSYPSFKASRLQQDRVRRSLYLDSTPYDWKYLASASETASPSLSDVVHLRASPNDDSDECSQSQALLRQDESRGGKPGMRISNFPSMSASSSMSVSGETEHTISLACNYYNNNRKRFEDINNITRQADLHRTEEADDETQFNFEADETEHDVEQQNCDRSNDLEPMDNTEAVIGASTSQLAGGGRTIKSPKVSISTDTKEGGAGNSIKFTSLDDEKFYDCCTEHEVSNST